VYTEVSKFCFVVYITRSGIRFNFWPRVGVCLVANDVVNVDTLNVPTTHRVLLYLVNNSYKILTCCFVILQDYKTY